MVGNSSTFCFVDVRPDSELGARESVNSWKEIHRLKSVQLSSNQDYERKLREAQLAVNGDAE